MGLNLLWEAESLSSSLQIWTHMQTKISCLSKDFPQKAFGEKKQTKTLPSLWSSERSYTGYPLVPVGKLSQCHQYRERQTKKADEGNGGAVAGDALPASS